MRIAASLMATMALVASTVLASPKHSDTIVINKKVLNTAKASFVPNNGTELPTNWVGLNVDFQYVKPVFDFVNATQSIANGSLISHGESHVTAILLPEYDNILHPAGVTIDELNTLATHKNRLQSAKFGLECLGRVQAVSTPDNVYQQAIQIILKDYDDIIVYREDVSKLYVKKGGNPALFDPWNFTPHITLGFRHRDIFVEDGIYKGKNACIRKIIAK
ncbi:hypothetical protein BGZ50_008552 [Haplosporangium sp. Z 11]|nr:hypothetical protein BGZ50_008552 [Haplosporangium sp. Z 11]